MTTVHEPPTEPTAVAERATGTPLRSRLVPRQRHIPVLATLVLFLVMYGAGIASYEGFSDTQVLLNVFIDNAFLLVVAVGMTFVILTGGIDLSVGAAVALTTMIVAELLKLGWPPAVVLPLVLVLGVLFGTGMGVIIHVFDIEPFIATLAGMFLCRGLSYVIATESIRSRTPSGPRWPTRRSSSVASTSRSAWWSRPSSCSSRRTSSRTRASAGASTRSAATASRRC
jgi:simple sugar transport system permease protein